MEDKTARMEQRKAEKDRRVTEWQLRVQQLDLQNTPLREATQKEQACMEKEKYILSFKE